jgi:DNA gyrase/topoisomerase IV subunit A
MTFDNKKVFEGVVGKSKGNPFNNMIKDSDGDKVMNVMDCQPYNKNKQGIIHDIKKRVKEKFKERKERAVAEQHIRKKSRAAGFREREKQQIMVAQEKERIKAKKQISKAKTGKGGFNLSAGLSALSGSGTTTSTSSTTPKTKRVKTSKFVKVKGGKFKKVKTQPKKPSGFLSTIPDIKL